MAHTDRPIRVKIWPNKEAEVEQVELAPDAPLTIVEDWGELVLVRDEAGRTFQLPSARVVR